MLVLAVLATVLNIVLLIMKFKLKRYENGLLDLVLLFVVFKYLKGSEFMLLTGIYSSLAISVYLWICPTNFIRVKK